MSLFDKLILRVSTNVLQLGKIKLSDKRIFWLLNQRTGLLIRINEFGRGLYFCEHSFIQKIYSQKTNFIFFNFIK